MTDAELIAWLAPDLAFLLQERAVAKPSQASWPRRGFTSLRLFALVADDRPSFCTAARGGLGVADALERTMLADAWETNLELGKVRSRHEAE